MKITLELKLPKELETILQTLSQAARVYTEGAMSFPPAEPTQPVSASVQVAEPVVEAVPVTQPSEPVEQSLTRLTGILKGDPKLQPRAMEILKVKGKQRLSQLTSDEMLEMISELGGVA